jgi:phage terminase large subunit
MGALQIPEVFEPLLGHARYKGAWGGRGSGKSHLFAGLLIARAASEKGFRAVCVREVQRSIADSVKQLLEDKIDELGLRGFFKVTDAEIRGRNNSLIIFRGLQNHTAASIKSLEGFRVAWVEEAQTISQKSLDILTPTIRDPGSELWFSWNPDADDDPVDKLLRVEPPEGAIVLRANWSDNPFFPDELRQDMERDRRRDPDKYAHVWEGAYRTASEARVFRNFREERLEVPERAVWFYGADWGFSVDPTAAVRFCFPSPETLYISHEVYEVGVPMEGIPALLAKLPDAQKWPMVADNARPETIDFVRRHGFPRLRGASKGKGSIEHGINFLQSFDIVIDPRCKNTNEEFRRYSYKTDRHTGEILPVIADEWNHAIDALRYGCERMHRKGKMRPGALKTEGIATRKRDYGFRNIADESDSWKVA